MQASNKCNHWLTEYASLVLFTSHFVKQPIAYDISVKCSSSSHDFMYIFSIHLAALHIVSQDTPWHGGFDAELA
ncbi:hypothetical protein CEXT_718841 [Caerostris extrusa]|uniref:Uncharacterized protein n=1 Tax=Caerostris extrusa TaxID=172846 RepID=A0AAV4PRN7_CAEEX|nr:hypothetical protein CEXT_718841 [Caerostris extrusa]